MSMILQNGIEYTNTLVDGIVTLCLDYLRYLFKYVYVITDVLEK